LRALDFWFSLLVSKIDEKICLEGAAKLRRRGLTPDIDRRPERRNEERRKD